LPNAWRETTVASIASVVTRGRAPAYEGGKTPVLNQKCIREGFLDLRPLKYTNESTRPIAEIALLQPGDVVITSTGRGTVGRSAAIPDDIGRITCDTHVTIVRPSPDQVVSAFLAILLGHNKNELEARATGSTNQLELGRGAISSFPLLLPPLEEQRRIAHLVDALDAALALARDVAAKGEGFRSALLEARIGDGLAHELAEAQPLRDLMVRVTRPVKVRSDNEYAQIGIRSFGRGFFHKAVVNGTELGSKRIFEIRQGDLVFNIVFAWEGAVALAGEDEDTKVGSHRFPTYIPNDEKVDRRYLLNFFRSKPGVELLQRMSPGSAGRNRTLNQTRLLDNAIAVPPLSFQQETVAILDALEGQIAGSDARIATLSNFRTAAIAELLAGTHTIPASYDDILQTEVGNAHLLTAVA